MIHSLIHSFIHSLIPSLIHIFQFTLIIIIIKYNNILIFKYSENNIQAEGCKYLGEGFKTWNNLTTNHLDLKQYLKLIFVFEFKNNYTVYKSIFLLNVLF